jgi:RNA polymerase sigma factor (sigma-70 family)
VLKTLEKFYKDNRMLLVKRLINRAGGIENAEDILQESFVRAIKYRAHFNPKKRELGAWFNTIMNNALKDFKRDERMGGMVVQYEEGMDESYEMSQTDPDMKLRILRAIAKRDLNTRSALHLYFIEEHKVKEIKEILDVPYKTVESIIYRFKADMSDAFGED